MNNFFLAAPVGKGNNFVKKLECCISGGHYMIISSYQLSFFVSVVPMIFMPNPSHSARSISFSLASKVSSSNFSQSGSLAT